jgi:ankyrin repeat protein
MRFLVENGANEHAKSNGGWTPLLSAIHNRQLDATFVLLDNGAELSVTNNAGNNALFYAHENKFLRKLVVHSTQRQPKTCSTEVQDKMDSTTTALSGQYNTGSAVINAELEKVKERNEQQDWEMVALQGTMKSDVAALSEQYSTGTAVISDELEKLMQSGMAALQAKIKSEVAVLLDKINSTTAAISDQN